jgi:hypothetical protein
MSKKKLSRADSFAEKEHVTINALENNPDTINEEDEDEEENKENENENNYEKNFITTKILEDPNFFNREVPKEKDETPSDSKDSKDNSTPGYLESTASSAAKKTEKYKSQNVGHWTPGGKRRSRKRNQKKSKKNHKKRNSRKSRRHRR